MEQKQVASHYNQTPFGERHGKATAPFQLQCQTTGAFETKAELTWLQSRRLNHELYQTGSSYRWQSLSYAFKSYI